MVQSAPVPAPAKVYVQRRGSDWHIRSVSAKDGAEAVRLIEEAVKAFAEKNVRLRGWYPQGETVNE